MSTGPHQYSKIAIERCFGRPFPELRNLHLAFVDELVPVDPDLFLGGTAPRLKTLFLKRLPVPGLPNLLLSASHLVRLEIHRIPDSGYISPEAMLAALSTLTTRLTNRPSSKF
jgi:hypothetical protein